MFSFIALSIILTTSVLAAEEPSCVISDSGCPCATKASSGKCMRHQGDNTCLLDDCSDGYKCDCFGFEHCSISSGSIFTTGDNAVPSSDTPFSCHLTAGAGKCYTFGYFLDTVNAADNAKAEGTSSMMDTTVDMVACTEDIQVVIGEKVTLDKTIEQLDNLAELVTEDERADIDTEVGVVIQAIKAVRAEEEALDEELEEATKANNQVGYFRRMCRRREAEAAEKEEEEKSEAVKPKNKVQCNRCEVLRKEIQELRKQRKEAAIQAGTWTKKAQSAKNRSRKRRKNVNKIRLSAEEARARCIRRSEKILARIRG